MYGITIPRVDDDSDDNLLKIIRHIMIGILEDVASGIAYIHKQLRFHSPNNFEHRELFQKTSIALVDPWSKLLNHRAPTYCIDHF